MTLSSSHKIFTCLTCKGRRNSTHDDSANNLVALLITMKEFKWNGTKLMCCSLFSLKCVGSPSKIIIIVIKKRKTMYIHPSHIHLCWWTSFFYDPKHFFEKIFTKFLQLHLDCTFFLFFLFHYPSPPPFSLSLISHSYMPSSSFHSVKTPAMP